MQTPVSVLGQSLEYVRSSTSASVGDSQATAVSLHLQAQILIELRRIADELNKLNNSK